MALEFEELTLGTAPDAKIQVSGMFVAKLHARIVPEKEGQFKIIHVAGLAGTRVNGERISERVLKPGDEIEIGKQRLLFRLER
jgi:pSer/pThr/pTyr-binding forkhead associated (FHA) protein